MRLPSTRPLVLSVLGLVHALALAQALPPGAVPRPPAPPDAPAPTRPLELNAPPRAALAPAAGVAVRVDRFTLSGNKRIESADIDTVLAPYVAQTLDFDKLREAANAVTDLYRKRGFLLAVAYLPEQQIRDGVVEIAVLEGQLGALTLGEVGPQLDRSFAESVLGWRLAPGDVVSSANLVRNLLVLNELPGIAVSADIRPAAAVGAADVGVDVREFGPRYAGSIVLDNHGTRFTGRTRLGGAWVANNLAGRGDALNLQAVAAQGGGQQSVQAGYSLLVHPSGTRVGASWSQLHYRIIDPDFSALDANGDAGTLAVTAEQALLRRVNYSSTLRVALAHKQARDRVDAVGQHEDRHLDTLTLGVRGEAREAGGSATRYSLGTTRGRVAFDDVQAEIADAVQRGTAGGFGHFNVELSRDQRVSDSVSLLARVWWQGASKNLDAVERVTLGGANAQRPFGARATSADDAALVSLDLRWRVPSASLAGLTLSGFVDYGRGRADHDPDPTVTDNKVLAATYGAGAEMALPWDLTLRMALARQAVSPRSAGEAKWTSHGWAELIKSF